MSEKKSIDKINKFLKKMVNSQLDKNNKCILKKGNAPVAVVAVPNKDLLLVSAPVINLPEENLLPLFRKLLTLNLSDTKDAAFAINEESGTIDLQIKRPLENLDYPEFERSVGTVAEVADRYNDILAETFGSPAVLLQSTKANTWGRYISSLNPFVAFMPKKDPRNRVRNIRAVFTVLSIVSAIGAGIFTYTQTLSWALGIFVFLWTQFIVARAIPDLITESSRIKRFIFFALHPAVGVALLLGTYELWEMWWLSALIGYVGGLFLGRIIVTIIMPQITLEETRDDKARSSAWMKAQGSGG
jgi:hypothetical protein